MHQIPTIVPTSFVVLTLTIWKNENSGIGTTGFKTEIARVGSLDWGDRLCRLEESRVAMANTLYFFR